MEMVTNGLEELAASIFRVYETTAEMKVGYIGKVEGRKRALSEPTENKDKETPF
jgi:hypothetical protein